MALARLEKSWNVFQNGGSNCCAQAVRLFLDIDSSIKNKKSKLSHNSNFRGKQNLWKKWRVCYASPASFWVPRDLHVPGESMPCFCSHKYHKQNLVGLVTKHMKSVEMLISLPSLTHDKSVQASQCNTLNKLCSQLSAVGSSSDIKDILHLFDSLTTVSHYCCHKRLSKNHQDPDEGCLQQYLSWLLFLVNIRAYLK